VALDKLIPYARNPRKNDSAVDEMVGSIREFGFKIPCLVRSDGEVVDGHLRLKAARKLTITVKVRRHRLTGSDSKHIGGDRWLEGAIPVAKQHRYVWVAILQGAVSVAEQNRDCIWVAIGGSHIRFPVTIKVASSRSTVYPCEVGLGNVTRRGFDTRRNAEQY
jgi:hypothetical protein